MRRSFKFSAGEKMTIAISRDRADHVFSGLLSLRCILSRDYIYKTSKLCLWCSCCFQCRQTSDPCGWRPGTKSEQEWRGLCDPLSHLSNLSHLSPAVKPDSNIEQLFIATDLPNHQVGGTLSKAEDFDPDTLERGAERRGFATWLDVQI